MNNIFDKIDTTLVNFWQEHNLTESDFYCRDCGKLLLNIEELSNVSVFTTRANVQRIVRTQLNGKIIGNYIESETNRWIVKGRLLSDKLYFRHICWECLFKKMPLLILNRQDLANDDNTHKTWERLVKNGKIYNMKIPVAWNSPTWYFAYLFDISIEDLNHERAKFNTASYDSFIKRHGKELGEIKYKEYLAKLAKNGNTLEYFIEKYGEDVGTKKYLKVCKDKGVSKQNCIKKYGKDIGRQFFKQYCDRQRYAGNKIEYFIEKYGEELGKLMYNDVCHKKALTYHNFIQKYGEELGMIKYNEYAFNHKTYSIISQELFSKIDLMLLDYAKDSYWATKNYEYELPININNEKHFAMLDYRLNDKVIEFYGDYWHANPIKYLANDTISKASQQLCASDIWSYDKQRIMAIESLGYKVKIVWESDYNADKEKVINECTEFLKL